MPEVKSDNLSVQSVKFGKRLLELQVNPDNEGAPVISIHSKEYKSLSDLLQDLPELFEKQNIKVLALLANFLFQGNKFQFIDDIAAFQQHYQNQIELESRSFEPKLRRLSDYGLFDTSGMHDPKIVDNNLIFYVKDAYTNLPYRVTCRFPITAKIPDVKYETLPYAE